MNISNDIVIKKLKLEIQVKVKKGIAFMYAAGFIWTCISLIWCYIETSSYNKSILTFIIGAFLLPLTYLFSQILKTNMKVQGNPLDTLGLWLNLAQIVYFPFLVFILLKQPDYFIMAYAIITGAHLFPYAWLYDETGYLVSAIVISTGSLLIALIVEPSDIWYIPLFTAVCFFMLAIWITSANRKIYYSNKQERKS